MEGRSSSRPPRANGLRDSKGLAVIIFSPRQPDFASTTRMRGNARMISSTPSSIRFCWPIGTIEEVGVVNDPATRATANPFGVTSYSRSSGRDFLGIVIAAPSEG
jgi:hypothetical protein